LLSVFFAHKSRSERIQPDRGYICPPVCTLACNSKTTDHFCDISYLGSKLKVVTWI